MRYSLVRQWVRNHFYDLYTYACVADDPTFVGYHFTSYDNPLLDPEEIEAAKKIHVGLFLSSGVHGIL